MRIGATAQLSCWGMKNQVNNSNTLRISANKKYFLTQFLLRLMIGATSKCVGGAQSMLKLFRHTSSMRMIHSVRITTPSKPSKKKNTKSNPLRNFCADADFENCNAIIITISNAKKNSGLNQELDAFCSGVGRIRGLLLTNGCVRILAVSNASNK